MNGHAILNGRGAVKAPFTAPSTAPQHSHLRPVSRQPPPLPAHAPARSGNQLEVEKRLIRQPPIHQPLTHQPLPSLAQTTVPIAKRLLSPVTQTLIKVIPRETTIATPSSILSQLLRQGEVRAAQQEAQFFGVNPAAMTVGRSTAAHHAVLTEVLAAEASHTPSASEAAVLIGTVIPVAIGSMEAGISHHLFSGSSLRRVLSTLLVATAHLVQLLHHSGSVGRRLIRLIPTILRRIVASLRAARQIGCLVTPALVGRTMVAHTTRVLGNPQIVVNTITRNARLRQRMVAAPPARFLNHALF
jgi:hypothetical protein